MPAVAVTVKKLVWLQLYPFLCKYAQPYIQCVADFFKNGSVYVLDCEAGLWRCTHADLPPSCSRLRLLLQTVGHAHVPQSASSLPSLSIWQRKNIHGHHCCFFCESDPVLVVGMFRCFLWLLIFLWVAAVFSDTGVPVKTDVSPPRVHGFLHVYSSSSQKFYILCYQLWHFWLSALALLRKGLHALCAHISELSDPLSRRHQDNIKCYAFVSILHVVQAGLRLAALCLSTLSTRVTVSHLKTCFQYSR